MKKIGVLILLIIVIGVGAYLLRNNTRKTSLSNSADITPNEKMSEAVPSVDVSDLKAGGSSYREESGAYTFLYPSDFVLDTNDKQHIRIYKNGSTQQGQTEMYDGVLLVFEVIALNGSTLSSWLDTHIKETTADGTSQITEAKKDVSLGNYSGFTYAVRGLGESKNYVFQKDTTSPYAVLISTAVNDPGNAGFQNDVDKVLSTLEIQK